MTKYYSSEKIRSKLDLNGKKPSKYIITSNRSAGKTTDILLLSLKRFKEDGTQCGMLYRYQYELNSAPLTFKDVLDLYPEYGKDITAIPHARGLFYEIILDGVTFGYSISLHNPDSLKKYSPVFAKVFTLIFDEFQPESGKYLSKEVQNLQSILVTIARGGGSQSREMELFMLSNMVSIMNPYFIEFGIHKRLRNDTNFLRGDGWVAEFGFNESASNSIKDNSLFSGFNDSSYMTYSTEKVYLNDATVFVEKVKGRCKYICTLIYDNKEYGVREYFDEGIILISGKPDKSCKSRISFKASDHNQNTIMLSHYSYLWKNIKDAFNSGYLRFDNIKTKSIIFDILAIDLYK